MLLVHLWVSVYIVVTGAPPGGSWIHERCLQIWRRDKTLPVEVKMSVFFFPSLAIFWRRRGVVISYLLPALRTYFWGSSWCSWYAAANSE